MFNQPSEDVQFLQSLEVHQDWIPFFLNDPDLLGNLYRSMSMVEKNVLQNNKKWIPEKRKTLLALSRCPPQDVKVVILGHDPIYDGNLATGFSFSFPKEHLVDENVGQREFGLETGKSLAVLHDVLVDAGYLERGAHYDSCHEEWADRGVLLLNASLTYSREHEHFHLWKDFVCRLLFLVALYSKQKHLFFLCWGTNAMYISKRLHTKFETCRYPVLKITDERHGSEIYDWAKVVVFSGDHPTYPKDDNKFAVQATNQFRAIKQWYPDLFNLPKVLKQESVPLT